MSQSQLTVVGRAGAIQNSSHQDKSSPEDKGQAGAGVIPGSTDAVASCRGETHQEGRMQKVLMGADGWEIVKGKRV